MTSVRACYCGQEVCASREKDNVIDTRNRDRRRATVVSKKSAIRSEIRERNLDETPGKAASVIDEEAADANRSAKLRSTDPVLSPETSTAIENAERIVNNAKIQLMEVCAMSTLDSARRNRPTYPNEPPLDDEVEELLYIRELVASKLQEASNNGSPKPEARNHDERNYARVTVRRVDLSTPKFRMSRRRRRDDGSSFLERETDERRRSRGQPTSDVVVEASSKDSPSTTSSSSLARSTRRKNTNAEQRNVCRIQIGPSVHVDGELTRQDLQDVHISPEPLLARDRSNTVTYTLRHNDERKVVVAVAENGRFADNDGTTRLGTSLREKRGRLTMIEVKGASEATAEAAITTRSASGRSNNDTLDTVEDENSDPRQGGITEGSPRDLQGLLVQEERKEKREDPEQPVPKHVASIDNGNKRADTENRKTRSKENVVNDTETSRKRNDRSKESPFVGDASREAEDIVDGIVARRRPMENPSGRIFFSHAFNSRNEKSADETTWDDVADSEGTNAKSSAIELYRPRLDDLDSILLSNERKIERVVRTSETLAMLLSKPEFTRYKPQPRFGSSKHQSDRLVTCDESTTRSSTTETQGLSKGQGLTASKDAIVGVSAKSSDASWSRTTREEEEEDQDRRGDYSRNSAESTVYPASDASVDVSATSREEDVTAQQRPTKVNDERPSGQSMDRSELTIFSDLIPALSSTRTEVCCPGDRRREEGEFDDESATKQRVVSANRFSKRATSGSSRRRTRDLFARILRGLKDETTDRFVTCILQDERQSVERKVTSALRESAMAPATLRRLLDRLRQGKSESVERRTETLDILRDILTNIKNETAAVAEERKICPRGVAEFSALRANVAPRVIERSTLREEEEEEKEEEKEEEDARETLTRVDELAEEGCTGSALNSHRDDKSEKRNARRRTLDPAEEVPIADKNPSDGRIDVGNEDNINDNEKKTHPRNDSAGLNAGPTTSRAEEKSARVQTQVATEIVAIAKSNDAREAEVKVNNNQDAASATRRDKEDNDESDVEDHPAVGSVAQETADRRTNDERPDPSGRTEITNEKTEQEDTRNNKEVSSTLPDISGSRNERARVVVASHEDESNGSINVEEEDATSRKAKNRLVPANSLLTEKSVVASSRATSGCEGADDDHRSRLESPAILTNGRISHANSADSLRDCASLGTSPSAKGESPAKESSAPRDDKEMSHPRVEDIDVAATTTTRKNREDASAPRRKFLSDSDSSVINGILLDRDDRSSEGAFSAKRIGASSSSEVSHSEGELYMPSSCSYSLGEVRVLEKCDLIADSTMDRDSSVTFLVTRSMLTSLNDSATSLLGSSGSRI